MHEVYRKLKYFSRKQISELYIFNKKIDYKFKSNKYFFLFIFSNFNNDKLFKSAKEHMEIKKF